mmetsp:Transcript_19153/g.30449  ORF Transcript_19153/g.30449 Transcript_19153/m.30449 type:complete len:260 (+) Transcript_19153:63-842(+)
MNCVLPQRSVSPSAINGHCNIEGTSCIPVYSSSQTASPSFQKRKMVILDWDDTLCPTTQLFKNKDGIKKIQATTLAKFGQQLYTFLYETICKIGVENVHIVTNGDRNWVQQSLYLLSRRLPISSCNYLTATANLLQLYAINVLSAKHLYNSYYSASNNGASCTMSWKLLAFKHIIQEKYMSSLSIPCEIICIGDSSDEWIACKHTQQWLSTIYNVTPLCHRIHLAKRPTLAVMQTQFETLLRLSLALKSASKDMDINLK